MSREPQKLLADVLAAAEAISQFRRGRSRQDYSADLMLRSAIERQLEILGEAIRRLDGIDASLAAKLTGHRRIIAFRNIIAHGYDGLDDDIVWQVVEEKLPVLVRDAKTILASLEQPGST